MIKFRIKLNVDIKLIIKANIKLIINPNFYQILIRIKFEKKKTYFEKESRKYICVSFSFFGNVPG
jgi:hypothetical protein